MEHNTEQKKITFPQKLTLILLLLFFSLILSMIPMIQLKTEKKLYRSYSKIKINFTNFKINEKEMPIDIFELIKNNCYSDSIVFKTMKDLGLFDKNDINSKNMELLLKLKQRIQFFKDYNYEFVYVIQLYSSEPKKSTKIVNSIAQNIKSIFDNELIKLIDNNHKYKINELLILFENKKINETDYKFLKNELLKRNAYIIKLFETVKPIIQIEPAVVPLESYYPEKEVIQKYIIYGFYINFFVVLIMIFILKMTSSLCETRKEYKLRKQQNKEKTI